MKPSLTHTVARSITSVKNARNNKCEITFDEHGHNQ